MKLWTKYSTRWKNKLNIPESLNDYFLQVNPAYSFLEQEIFEWIERYCSEKKKDPNKKEKLRIHTIEGNPVRELLLSGLGYKKGEASMYLRFFAST